MTKTIVIIAGSCIPNPSATGSMAIRLGSILSKDFRYNVIIICAQQENNKYNGVNVDGITYYTISNLRLNRFQHHTSQVKTISNSLLRFYHLFLAFFYRALGRFVSIFSYSNSPWFASKVFRLLKKIHNNDFHINLVISFNSPIESHFAAMKFKRYCGCRFISYISDLIPSPNTNFSFVASKKRLLSIEKKIIEDSEKCFVTEEIYSDLQGRFDAPLFGDRIVNIKYCLNQSVLNLSQKNTLDIKFLKFLYYGSFYKDIRNPNYMISFFDKLQNFTLDIYAAGNCDLLIRKSLLFGKRVFLFNPIPFDELTKKVIESDVLINVENSGVISKPSKLFELISFGKPIISFGCNNDGFDYYGQVCFLNEKEPIEKNISKMKSFLNNFKFIYNKSFLEKAYSDRLESNYKATFLSMIETAGN